MERYNPFDISDPHGAAAGSFGMEITRTSSPSTTATSTTVSRFTHSGLESEISPTKTKSSSNTIKTSRYTTTFPDPFPDLENESNESSPKLTILTTTSEATSARSNSITYSSSTSHSVDEQATMPSPIRNSRQTGGISSFLTRATSVTSSSMTERVSEAVGSMKSAVDSLSNQIQQVVPSNLNERLSSTANQLINSSTNLEYSQSQQPQQQQQQTQQQSQSTASYLASKFSSATNQFTSSAQSNTSQHMISRQRVILILDNPANNSWAQHFANFRKQTSASATTQSTFTSFFSSATASLAATSQALTSGVTSSSLTEGADLIEQVDYRDVTILANQGTSTATLLVSNNSTQPSGNLKSSTRIIRPEYVVVKQRTKSNVEHMRSLVTALNYSLIPMFEPIEIWNIFQDRMLIFSKLLRVQKQLGKENFPLIPQVYCQTHQDLMNYITSSASLPLPCLVRTGLSGRGKIRADNVQVLKTLASIVATNDSCCTLEPFLDVKCDLLVQKLGTNLKLLKRTINSPSESGSAESARGYFNSVMADNRQEIQYNSNSSKLPASRQTSIGSSVLSSLMSATNQQQLTRRNSNPMTPAYEKSFEVNSKYRSWIEAIAKEFDHKLEVFSIKIAVTTNDREYVVGLTDCSMDFVGSPENQEEDRRSFIELVMSNMNNNMSKVTTNDSIITTTTPYLSKLEEMRRYSSDDKSHSTGTLEQQLLDSPLKERKFSSQKQVNGIGSTSHLNNRSSFGQMGNRSQSVSVNQSLQDGLVGEQPMNKSSYLIRRISDQGLNESDDSLLGSSNQLISESGGLHQRQSSLGQSFFDQTSTAFSSLHKQSISLLKRFDSRASDGTPPQSAKSDQVFDRSFQLEDRHSPSSTGSIKRNGFKSQSIDSSTLDNLGSVNRNFRPPKPPPPKSMPTSSTLKSSLSRKTSSDLQMTTSTMQPKQNSSLSNLRNGESSNGEKQRVKVVRQNSALSAFEPFDPDLLVQPTVEGADKVLSNSTTLSSTGSLLLEKPSKPLDLPKKNVNFDSASITSGDSNSTNETTTAEDTMNNLKKTFASIFGDKCE